MRLVDANMLIYSLVASFPQHEKAKAWLDKKLNDSPPLGLPWPSLLSFVRLVANPRIFERPEPVSEAWTQVEGWVDAPASWIPQPTDRHVEILGSLMTKTIMKANLVPDAHLAALAIEHGLTVCSTDGDFARFPNLSWVSAYRSTTGLILTWRTSFAGVTMSTAVSSRVKTLIRSFFILKTIRFSKISRNL